MIIQKILMRMLHFLSVLLIVVAVSDLAYSHGNARNVGTVIGIDLGTKFSRVGVFKNEQIQIFPNRQGNRITPSCVAFSIDGELLIGDAAMNQLTLNPKNTVFDVKRLIGRTWDDPAVQNDIKFFPFNVIENKHKPHIQINVKGENKTFAAEEVSAMILREMKEIAEAYLGENITHSVVTVPTYFTNAQRQATIDAGTIAGLNILRIINEPSAAAIAYGLDKKECNKNVLVFNIGGGTVDVSLLNISYGTFNVLATNGDAHLGGKNFDQNIMEYFIKLYKEKTGKDVSSSPRALQKLLNEVEKAKKALSSQQRVTIEIENFFDGKDYSETLTRAKFEELNMKIFDLLLEMVKKTLDDSRLKIKDVDELVLVGGSSRIPKIQNLVKKFFNGKNPNRGINLEEAVVYGAAIQASALSEKSNLKDLVFHDVNSLTFGFENAEGIMTKLISRNTVFPTKITKIFSTTSDNQQNVTINVLQGEEPRAKDNNHLGKFDLISIPAAPRGVPQIEVTFEIDVNGILRVSAEEKGIGSKKHIIIEYDENRLSKEDVKRMVENAEKFAANNQKLKERYQALNELERFAYSLKYHVNDENKSREKVSGIDKEIMQKAIDDIILWLNEQQRKTDDEDYKELYKKMKGVSKIIHSNFFPDLNDVDFIEE